jgi:diguanylate cyclase (GGDEF)-like protein
MFIETLLRMVEQQRQSWIIAIGYTWMVGLGIIDYLTGFEVSFSLFYVFPIVFVTWRAGHLIGIISSITSAIIWEISNLLAGVTFSHPLIIYWNTLIRLGFFLLITWLIGTLKHTLEKEQALSRIDFLTGSVNSRAFSEIADRELLRIRRHGHPFTISYIDLDNFKSVNDQLGHSVGDSVLRMVVDVLKAHLRGSDIVARLGGDEFAVFFPETDAEAAKIVIPKIQQILVTTMIEKNYPVTFSFGVVTCLVSPPTLDDLIMRADDLMYAVKKRGKNAIQYAVYKGDQRNENDLADGASGEHDIFCQVSQMSMIPARK